MHWTAAPAVPLARLSMAPTATSRPAASSTVTCRCTALEPVTDLVCGHWPSGSRCTNGSSAYAFAYAARTRRRSTPSCSGARAGGEDAARHRHQQRREADPTVPSVEAGEVLDDLGGVPVDAADAVRAGVAHHLAAEQVRLGGLAGAAGAGGGDHDDVGLDEPGGDGRGQGSVETVG